MDLARILLVPFQPTVLMLVAFFSVVLAICSQGAIIGVFGIVFVSIGFFQYCFEVLEHVAEGRREAPVFDQQMLSSLNWRPFLLAAVIAGAFWGCILLKQPYREPAWFAFLLVLPACIAVLGLGDKWYQAVNPVRLALVIKGIGPYYLLMLILSAAFDFLTIKLTDSLTWSVLVFAIIQFNFLLQFALIGGVVYLRRAQLGWEPTKSPERDAEVAERERQARRARMMDEVYQKVRVGRHVDATKPLADWFVDHLAHALQDTAYIVEHARNWDSPGAFGPIGSTLIRHMLKAGKPDVAITVFTALRREFPGLRLDDPGDVSLLADYAQSTGRARLAEALRADMTAVTRPK
jgi:hypothetical protein